MIAVAVNNSSKESWRQNQRTSDTIRFTTVSTLFGLTFLGRMGSSGHRRLCLSPGRLPPASAFDSLTRAYHRRARGLAVPAQAHSGEATRTRLCRLHKDH